MIRLEVEGYCRDCPDFEAKVEKTDNFKIEALMTCFALAEHRLYGFGSKRIMRSLQCIDELMGDILNDTKTIDDYKKELEENAGVIVQCN